MTASMLINIDVPELERASRFYCEAFGLTRGRRLGEAGIELLGAGVPICLLQADAGSKPFLGAVAARSYERHWSPTHLDFAVDDLEEGLRVALAAGAHQESDRTDHKWGRMVLLSDPFGNGVCLLEFNEQGYDAIAG